MPLSHSFAQAVPGDCSSSRKRSHAEITRSESRSQSPQPPSKRRRTVRSPEDPYTSASSESFVNSVARSRYVGDGLDYRQPVMSTGNISQSQEQETIDLTQDDDSPPPPPPPPPRPSSFAPSNHSSMGPAGFWGILDHTTAPPFPLVEYGQEHIIVDLSSDENTEEPYLAGLETGFTPSSPEVEFIRERALPRPPEMPGRTPRRPHLPTPPAMGHFGSMVNFVRGMTQNYFVNLRGPRELPEEALNRIDGLLNHAGAGRDGMNQPPDAPFDEYAGLQMNYGQAAFDMGADVLVIEDPTLHNGGANRANDRAYKTPLPAREGYTRNYEEDDMLICGFCGDELATGKTEQKQQVWIIKQCGHAYCGDCTHNRNISKNKNNKDTKRQANRKTNGFRNCAVPGCSKAVDSKTKMFQIYL